MATGSEMTVEATLSGGAAKLFLYLLRRGRAWGSMAEMMAGAGISKPTYLAAKRELLGKELDLRGFGFLPSPVKEVDHEVKYFGPAGQETLPSGASLFTPMQTVLDSTDALTDADFARGMQALTSAPRLWTGTAAPSALEAPDVWLPQSRVPAEERNFSEVLEKFPLALCQEADRMPADGDPLRSSSPFQLRRTAQVEALRKAYSQLCPEQTPLTIQRAKELLVAAENVAESAYEALEAAADKEYPFNYARKILLNRPKRPVDHSDEYLEWTPELQEKQRRGEEKMRAMGLPAYFFGDDDDD